MMSLKVKETEERRITVTLTTNSVPSPRHQMKMKALQVSEKAFYDSMIPTTSGHRCSPRRSPACVKKSLVEEGHNSQAGPLSRSIGVLPLSSMEDECLNLIVEDDDDMLTRSHHTEASISIASEDTDDAQKYGYGQDLFRQGNYCGENDSGEVTTDMILDKQDGEERIGKFSEPSPLIHDTGLSMSNELPRKVFCPNRVPRRSSFKRMDGSLSPPSSRRTSFQESEILEVILPGKRVPIKRQRSITFDTTVDIQKVEPTRLLALNPQSLWFQETEYETIKIKTLALLDKVDHSSGIVDGKKYCTRGLERFMEPEVSEVKKHQAWDSVLNEQFLQRKDGEFDEESLADIYRCTTRRSKTEATRRASLDAEAAAAILKATFSTELSHEPDKASTFKGGRRMSM